MPSHPQLSPASPRSFRFPALLGVALCATLVACSDGAPTAPVAPASPDVAAALDSRSVTEPVGGPWSRVVTGETGPGSLYGLYVPRNWNGDAVYFAHGFRDAQSPVDLRDQDALYMLRDALGAQGFAVAYSSYSTNGFAVKDGAQRTHQLRGLLGSELPGKVDRNFLIGHSLGGGIALDLAERYPKQYDGALLVCGMVGGSLLQTQYLGHVRALFDRYFPGVLPGNVLGVPTGTVVTLPQVGAAVASKPMALFAIASTAQTPLPYVPAGPVTNPAAPAFQTLVGSLYGALSFHARGINGIVDMTNGHSPFDNSSTVYAMGTPVLPPFVVGPMIDSVNADVARYTMAPAAGNYLRHHFTPTGDLKVPVLTLHNTWDPAVPLFHEAALLQAAQAAGATNMLVQRQVPSYGHCAIPAPMVLGAFGDLTGWAASGVKP